MKVASVDRIGSWRPPNADARAVTSNRLQTIAAVTANSIEPQELSSGTELPPLPVQKTQEILSRPVLQSDKPTSAQPQFADSTQVSFRNESVPTVEAYKLGSSSTQPNQNVDGQTQSTEVKVEQSAPQSLLAREQARQNPDNLSSLEMASQSAAQRAAEQAKKEAAQPPQVPISKMLMDQVRSMWEASGKAVEAALAPAPPPITPAQTAPPSSVGSSTDVTYSVPRQAAGPN